MENTTLTLLEKTIKVENKFIWIKPLCNIFDLHAKNQYIKIKNDPLLSAMVGKNSPDLGFIDASGRIFLTKKGFCRWVQIINPKTIREDLQASFIQYQSIIFDFLFGSIEREEDIQVTYARLKKLKGVRNRVNAEILICQKKVDNYLEGKVTQGNLDFKKPPQLPSK